MVDDSTGTTGPLTPVAPNPSPPTDPPPASNLPSSPSSAITPDPTVSSSITPAAVPPPTTTPTWDPYASPTSQAAPAGSAGASSWDPYAGPLAQAPPPYASPAPYSPYSPSPYSPTPAPVFADPAAPVGVAPPGTLNFPAVTQGLRFMQEIRLRDSYLFNLGGTNGLSVNDVETSATFAIPFFRSDAPLLITPGFGMHFFGGPITGPPSFADLPPRTYEGYIDAGWHPQINSWLSANLGVRGGAYTDFNTFDTRSIRLMGRGLAIVRLTPTLQVAAGAVYIDRVLIKLLPAGGLIWIPNPDALRDSVSKP